MRDHSSLVKSMYEEHLCVVALTSSERGTGCLLLPRVIRHLLIYFFQVNPDVSYLLLIHYIEDIYDDGGPLCPCFKTLDPNPMCLPLPPGVLYHNQNLPLFISCNIITFLVFYRLLAPNYVSCDGTNIVYYYYPV